MSITPGPWKFLDGALFSEGAGYHVLSFSAKAAGELGANTRAQEEVPNMIDLLRKISQKELHMHYAAEDADAILKRIEG